VTGSERLREVDDLVADVRRARDAAVRPTEPATAAAAAFTGRLALSLVVLTLVIVPESSNSVRHSHTVQHDMHDNRDAPAVGEIKVSKIRPTSYSISLTLL